MPALKIRVHYVLERTVLFSGGEPQAVQSTKRLLELDVAGHNMGDAGAAALGAALRKNRSITSLSYDRNSIELEGFKAVRGCLYGNKKLINVSAPVDDYKVSD